MRANRNLLFFVAGIAITLLAAWGFRKLFNFSEEKTSNDYYVLTNQISKMNKMVVMEQDFSTMQKTKVTYEILGSQVSENSVVTFTKTNAQVSYDLNKMKLEVDSINKKLIIRELPNADIRVTPNVEIQSIDDSFFNRVDEAQIKKVTKTAKEHALKQINEAQLRSEGRKQLSENLNSIFVLAKALGYEIVDNTNQLDLSKL